MNLEFYRLIVESNSSNAITWVSNQAMYPWKFQFVFNEIRDVSSILNVAFHCEVRSANSMLDALAKQWVKRLSPWLGFVIKLEVGYPLSLFFWFPSM